jgi:flagellar hook protein FlgE
MSFYTSLTGLNGAQADIAAISNNIANVGTTGFKRSRAEFGDIFATSPLQAASSAIGSGTILKSIKQQFTQGNITFTDNNLDLAISGNGFFVVDDNGTQLYSRDGAFGIDRDGYVVNSNSQKLKAFGADSTGAITGTLGPLRISTANTSPKATTLVNFGANLDSQETVPTIGVFDPTNNSSFNSTTATTS